MRIDKKLFYTTVSIIKFGHCSGLSKSDVDRK